MVLKQAKAELILLEMGLASQVLELRTYWCQVLESRAEGLGRSDVVGATAAEDDLAFEMREGDVGENFAQNLLWEGGNDVGPGGGSGAY